MPSVTNPHSIGPFGDNSLRAARSVKFLFITGPDELHAYKINNCTYATDILIGEYCTLMHTRASPPTCVRIGIGNGKKQTHIPIRNMDIVHAHIHTYNTCVQTCAHVYKQFNIPHSMAKTSGYIKVFARATRDRRMLFAPPKVHFFCIASMLVMMHFFLRGGFVELNRNIAIKQLTLARLLSQWGVRGGFYWKVQRILWYMCVLYRVA